MHTLLEDFSPFLVESWEELYKSVPTAQKSIVMAKLSDHITELNREDSEAVNAFCKRLLSSYEIEEFRQSKIARTNKKLEDAAKARGWQDVVVYCPVCKNPYDMVAGDYICRGCQ